MATISDPRSAAAPAVEEGSDADPILPPSEAEDVLASLAVAAFRWDARTDRLAWSPGATRILGGDADALPATGRAFHRLLTPETAHARAAAVPPIGTAGDPASRSGAYRIVYDVRPREPGSAAMRIEEQGRWFAEPDGRAGADGLVRVIETDGEVAAAPAPAVSPVTGLLLRDSLMAGLEMAVRSLARDRHGAAAFLVIAVDDLSRINTDFGYDVGDRLITTVARRIAGRMRLGDILGHMSGHKFGAVLHNCSEMSLATAAERFRTAVAGELIDTVHTEVQASISIGGVVVPRHAADAETAALRAEEALAEARAAAGGFQVYRPSPEREQMRRRNLGMAEEIVRGLAEDRFVVAYQPIVDALSRRVVSYEALARLVRRDGMVISAGPLVGTAERIGLVRRIDLRMLRLVMDDLAINPGLRLSVNASVETITDPSWLSLLVEAASGNRTLASRLTIEITETSAMRSLEEMLRISQTLRDIGCRVALDDFGAGHTSFKALRALEIDCVKIDGSFVRDVATNRDSAAFVKTLAALADHFAMGTVAEWVQDEPSARLLADFGIRGLQGRHVGEPMLRETALTAPAIAHAALDRIEADTDGHASCRGLLAGPIDLGASILDRS